MFVKKVLVCLFLFLLSVLQVSSSIHNGDTAFESNAVSDGKAHPQLVGWLWPRIRPRIAPRLSMKSPIRPKINARIRPRFGPETPPELRGRKIAPAIRQRHINEMPHQRLPETGPGMNNRPENYKLRRGWSNNYNREIKKRPMRPTRPKGRLTYKCKLTFEMLVRIVHNFLIVFFSFNFSGSKTIPPVTGMPDTFETPPKAQNPSKPKPNPDKPSTNDGGKSKP